MAVNCDAVGSRSAEVTMNRFRTSGFLGCTAVAAELAKVRVNLMVVVTTAIGFLLAVGSTVDGLLMFQTLAATGLLAGGAAVLNQFFERDYDLQMHRTASRPLPSGRVRPLIAGLFGAGLGVGGFVWLVLDVNALTAGLGATTFVLYVFVYTPLKRVTIWNTVIGAIPGAIPPMMGWAAVRNDLASEAWLLFAILFCWQMPHFYAIAWLYREDYRQAGYRMLSHHDESGRAVGWHSVVFAGLLCLVTVWLIVLLGLNSTQHQSWLPLVCSVLGMGLSGYYLFESFRFARCRTRQRARQLFFASIVYIPLLCALLVAMAVSDRAFAVGGAL